MKTNKHIKRLDYPEYTGLSSMSSMLDLAQHRGRGKESNYLLSNEKDLLNKIAKLEKVKRENILLTAGADAALHHVSETFLEKGKIAIIPTPSFGRLEFHTKVVGAKPIFVKFTKFPFSFDPKKITKFARRKKAAVIFLINPNNPTGELIGRDAISKFIKDNSKRLVVIDEVLLEEQKNSACSLVNTYKNLVVIKSFSKLFEIPGLRVGYIVTNKALTEAIAKTVSPYEISSLSLLFLKKILTDSKYVTGVKDEIKKARDLLKKESPLLLTSTDASLTLIYSNKKPSLFDYLLKRGILTVEGKNFRGLEKTNTVRVVIRSQKDMHKLIKVLTKYE